MQWQVCLSAAHGKSTVHFVFLTDVWVRLGVGDVFTLGLRSVAARRTTFTACHCAGNWHPIRPWRWLCFRCLLITSWMFTAASIWLKAGWRCSRSRCLSGTAGPLCILGNPSSATFAVFSLIVFFFFYFCRNCNTQLSFKDLKSIHRYMHTKKLRSLLSTCRIASRVGDHYSTIMPLSLQTLLEFPETFAFPWNTQTKPSFSCANIQT